MAQDLKKLFENDNKTSNAKMPEGHEVRFLQKLEKASPARSSRQNQYRILQIAASFLVFVGLVFGVYKYHEAPKSVETDIVDTEDTIKDDTLKSLGDISPDFKKVEDYYLANINLELSKVKQTPENKELFDGYVIRLAELNQEYKRLSVELTQHGPNELTVSALIDNLKLRLNLLYDLKEQLNDLNISEDHKIRT
ncbi:MAG: hypothetical protein WA775_09180 [Psychroserpens sp.]|uniref:hypothetical protein n=1 Tax=Psychroserpens sp. TaxID=2020870 RepID=UPI003CC0E1AA